MPEIEIYSAYNRPKGRATSFKDVKSKTEQAHKNDCDINEILRRSQKTGTVPTFTTVIGDFANLPDYHEAQQRLAEAKEAFDRLPSKTRSFFKNDPIELVNYALNPENRAMCESLGILPKQPQAVDPVAPASTTGAEISASGGGQA